MIRQDTYMMELHLFMEHVGLSKQLWLAELCAGFGEVYDNLSILWAKSFELETTLDHDWTTTVGVCFTWVRLKPTMCFHEDKRTPDDILGMPLMTWQWRMLQLGEVWMVQIGTCRSLWIYAWSSGLLSEDPPVGLLSWLSPSNTKVCLEAVGSFMFLLFMLSDIVGLAVAACWRCWILPLSSVKVLAPDLFASCVQSCHHGSGSWLSLKEAGREDGAFRGAWCAENFQDQQI